MHSKDEVLVFLLRGHVHLSKKDYGFFHNLQLVAKNNKPITSNQAKLFDKLLIKYQRQIRKNNLDSDQLLSLPWNINVIESLPEYLDPKVYLDNDLICIKSPFSTKFINKLRQENLNTFIWDKANKIYKSPYNTYSLKQAIELVKLCYDKVNICDRVTNLLEETRGYENKIWAPTLLKVRDNFYVSSINSSLYDAIQNIPLNDEPKTLFMLSRFGIKIDPSILKNKTLQFASNYRATVNIEDLPEMVNWLLELGIEHVILSRDLVYNKQLSLEVRNLLEDKISYGTAREINTNKIGTTVNLGLSSNNSLREKDVSLAKIITISNTRPVIVK